MLSGERFIKCITTPASAWGVLARRSSEARAFDFWEDGGSAMLVFAQFLGICCEMTTAIQLMSEIGRSDEGRAQRFAPFMTGPLTPAVRGLADLTASFCAFLAVYMVNPTTLAWRVAPKLTLVRLAHATVDNLCRAGFGYVSAAIYRELGCFGGPSEEGEARVNEIQLGAHISLHTALAVHASGQWEGAGMEIPPTKNAVGGWCATAGIVHRHMREREGQNANMVVAVALHYLVVLAALPPNTVPNIGDELDGLFESAAALKPFLLPTDAPGLETLVQQCGHNAPDAVAELRELVEAAKSTENLEQRQRCRLDLLVGGLPPGVCHSLLCSSLLPPEKLLKCSGCMLAKYCSSHCSKIDWKRGHKASCRAIVHERGDA
jgi:hypothetical protein